ncbi:Rrf2 family transcriptional regulator [Desulfurispirillum indicum]|uniref:Transcriptional regulator, Rrf2 family n=1 Tax=Desulfurispirillum indicum (strain ATCC BAA-1389 / DSM 22839 / S5) TaxID=653733 RepID=E6W0W5_DESIS|nr:Rrf2 family transcriptional regulator [Desulfurispirillum indicum]ADU65297.1 transcriptional regulator, Rrf2 family [Desulfurispirillum indicum S5]UCZ57194.1 Rrf2 family transcriptional regulator [Desulfurispirillum indicum]
MSTFIRKETDYALRIAVYLANKQERVKVSEICQKLNLTKPVVIKVIQMLKRHGLVASKTGKYGGLSLAHPPEEISVYDVLVSMSADHSINTCLEDASFCQLQPICRISRFFCDIQRDFNARLKSVKLAGLTFDDEQLEALQRVKALS